MLQHCQDIAFGCRAMVEPKPSAMFHQKLKNIDGNGYWMQKILQVSFHPKKPENHAHLKPRCDYQNDDITLFTPVGINNNYLSQFL